VDTARLVEDFVHTYDGYHTSGGICRVRIFRPAAGPPVVVCTELPDNKNTSVTNMAEYLAAEVVLEHFADRAGDPEGFLWIEHYGDRRSEAARARRPEPRPGDVDAERFAIVRFASYRVEWVPRFVDAQQKARPKLGRPTWRHLTRSDVEKLTGSGLAD
jgi:hypothetical protein